jgi:hypothetical protein
MSVLFINGIFLPRLFEVFFNFKTQFLFKTNYLPLSISICLFNEALSAA